MYYTYNIIKLIILLFCLIFQTSIHKCLAIKLTSVSLSYTKDDSLYNDIIKDFNKYAKENNIDVELSINLYTPSNSSLIANHYGNSIDYLLSKNSTKYDIIFFDTIYSSNFSPYLTDINGQIPEDHLNLYSTGIASKTCIVNNKWIGLPLYVDYSTMYVNTEYLNKYNKDIPTTWDKLLEVGKTIYRQELKNGNKNIIGYNGLFPDEEVNMCSTLEFIYSFRNEFNSSIPDYNSKEAIMALNKLKEIKNELSSDGIFLSETESVNSLFSGNSIFLKYWYLNRVNPTYKKILIPGNKENISGSCVGGFIIGINDHISKEKKKLALEALIYMTSKNVQKKYVMENKIISAINELYNDEEVCMVLDCNLIKGLQPIIRPSSLIRNYDEYSYHHTLYIHEFLYGNKTATETLNNIINILKIYSISINPKDDVEGFIIFIITIIIAIIILFSLLLIFNKRYSTNFSFLTKDLWVITFSGLILILVFIVSEYGNLTPFKCILKIITIFIGYKLTIIPSLHKLIVNFPENNKFSRWVKSHKIIFISGLILISGIEIILLLISSPFEIEVRTIPRGKNFKDCKLSHLFGIILFMLIVFEVFLLQGIVGFLVFIEWNIKKTTKDIKLIHSGLSFSFVLFIIILILSFVKFDNYKIYFSIYTSFVILLSLLNYIFMFILRMLQVWNSLETDEFYKNDMSEFKTSISKNIDDNSSSEYVNIKKNNSERMSFISDNTRNKNNNNDYNSVLKTKTNTNTNNNNNINTTNNSNFYDSNNNHIFNNILSSIIKYHYKTFLDNEITEMNEITEVDET